MVRSGLSNLPSFDPLYGIDPVAEGNLNVFPNFSDL